MEKNMLFATLDVSQRKIRLDTNREFILVDTVGFVSPAASFSGRGL